MAMRSNDNAQAACRGITEKYTYVIGVSSASRRACYLHRSFSTVSFLTADRCSQPVRFWLKLMLALVAELRRDKRENMNIDISMSAHRNRLHCSILVPIEHRFDASVLKCTPCSGRQFKWLNASPAHMSITILNFSFVFFFFFFCNFLYDFNAKNCALICHRIRW